MDAGAGRRSAATRRGERLSVEFLSAAGFRINELEMAVIQSQWKQACVEATLRFEPSRTLFGQTTKHRAVSRAW